MLSKKLKEGVKCVVIANNSRHNRDIGIIVTIKNFYDGGHNNAGYYVNEFGGTWFHLNDLKLWEQSRKDLTEELSEYKSKIQSIKYKLDYMNESKKEVVNINEYKEYCLGKIIDSSSSSKEKAEAIMDLMDDKPKKSYKIIDLPKRKHVPENEEVEEMETEMEIEDEVPHDQN